MVQRTSFKIGMAITALCALWLCGAIGSAALPVGAGQRTATASTDHLRRILYFEGSPRPEMKFINRAAADGPKNLRVVTLQRTADGKYMPLGVDGADELRDGFPASREELFKYKGLILGSVDANLFTTFNTA